jgi:hypothetical protein
MIFNKDLQAALYFVLESKDLFLILFSQAAFSGHFTYSLLHIVERRCRVLEMMLISEGYISEYCSRIEMVLELLKAAQTMAEVI